MGLLISGRVMPDKSTLLSFCGVIESKSSSDVFTEGSIEDDARFDCVTYAWYTSSESVRRLGSSAKSLLTACLADDAH